MKKFNLIIYIMILFIISCDDNNNEEIKYKMNDFYGKWAITSYTDKFIGDTITWGKDSIIYDRRDTIELYTDSTLLWYGQLEVVGPFGGSYWAKINPVKDTWYFDEESQGIFITPEGSYINIFGDTINDAEISLLALDVYLDYGLSATIGDHDYHILELIEKW
ncbi:hypothetical protein OAQ99_06020 [Candidatus Kapabacteria bacterium]|nr:hypothetical protein [Candidatus Kapabacteria bacterium]